MDNPNHFRRFAAVLGSVPLRMGPDLLLLGFRVASAVFLHVWARSGPWPVKGVWSLIGSFPWLLTIACRWGCTVSLMWDLIWLDSLFNRCSRSARNFWIGMNSATVVSDCVAVVILVPASFQFPLSGTLLDPSYLVLLPGAPLIPFHPDTLVLLSLGSLP